MNKVVDAVLDVSLTEPQQALCLKHVLKHPRLGRHCQSIGLSTDAQLDFNIVSNLRESIKLARKTDHMYGRTSDDK